MKPSRPDIVLDSFVPNGEWELLATRAWRVIFVEYDIEVERVYYEVTLRRRPSLLVLTVLLPVFILALVNVFVFAVPSESGECCVNKALEEYTYFNALNGSWVLLLSILLCCVLTIHSRRVGTFFYIFLMHSE